MADKLDLTKPVQTRDGRPVRILCVDARRGNDRHVVGLIDNNGFNDVVCVWGQDGMVYSAKIDDAVCGLINVPPKPVKYYADLWELPGGRLCFSSPYTDPVNGPISHPHREYIKTIEFEVQP